MSGFSADWLALREPYDAGARNREVLAAVAAEFAALPSMNIVDLACGTGSTLRTLASQLAPRQNWKLVDNDLGLLARAAATTAPRTTIATATVDLARDLEAALDGAVDLVTTSALLDLVSAEWLDRFATEAAARRIPVYAALSYDGRITLEPSDPFDARVIRSVNDHQLTNKGFGPALGPHAAEHAIARFKALGYSVIHGQADWNFAPSDANIQIAIIDGWAGAARELDKLSLPEIMGWLTRRRDLIASGRASMRVGHIDFFAIPTGLR